MQGSPTETGLYWARTSYSTEWDHIVYIRGESPFLNYIAWNLKFPLNPSVKETHLKGINPVKFMFGDKITNNPAEYISGNIINTPENKGLYLAVPRCNSDNTILLVYITGEVPYLECFTWDIKKDLKTEDLDVNLLVFLKNIKQPIYLETKT